MSEQKDFKTNMDRLEEITNALQKNDIPLEQAMELFEEGLQLVNSLETQLSQYEEKVNMLIKTYQKADTDEPF